MSRESTRSRCPTVLAVLAAASISAPAFPAELSGELRQWHTITFTFDGPASSEAATPNPFTAFRLSLDLRHPASGDRYFVPGFFAADGDAGETSATTGNKWRVRFSPPRAGSWNYEARLFHGDGAAISNAGEDLTDRQLIGQDGSFDVAPSDKPPNDLRHHGHLRYVGERYLRFAGSQRYFLKAGTDSPETLLGYHDFDGTWHDLEQHPVPAPHDPIELPSLDEGLHRYPTHVVDWRDGDPTWRDSRGKGLIGGIHYLAEQGVNSILFPDDECQRRRPQRLALDPAWQRDRFDVSKLDQWEIVFEHMQRRGLMMHVVLQETENDHLLDGGS